MNENYQYSVFKKYRKFELEPKDPKLSETESNVCEKRSNKEKTLTKYQLFLQSFAPEIPYKGILIFHKLGSGKTLTSILMAQSILNSPKYKNYTKVEVLLPASLRVNYKKEMESVLSSQEINNYIITSYNSSKIKDISGFNNKIVVIDEVQNFISAVKNKSKNSIDIYKKLISSNCKIICLSGTPVTNIPYEYAVLFNLLKPDSFKLNITDFLYEYIDFDNFLIKNQRKFYSKIKGLVSYYRGEDENSTVFPKYNISNQLLDMKPLQENYYLNHAKDDNPKLKKGGPKVVSDLDMVLGVVDDDKKMNNNFYIASRLACNSAFEDLSQINKETLLHLEDYSVKYSRILELIKESPGPVLVYSNFISKGLNEIEKILKLNSIPSLKWIGGQKDTDRKSILEKFNNPENIYKKIVLLVSKAGAEGLSLHNVRQIHILEPHWNVVRLQQVIGRGIRMCSHYKLPRDQQLVNVFIYQTRLISVNKKTADQHIFDLAEKKSLILDSFENMIKKSALDCQLNINQNQDISYCYE